MRILFLTLTFSLVCSVLFAQNQASPFPFSDIIQVFQGQWEGEATAYFPRDAQKPNRIESIKAEGKIILKNSYVELYSTWTQPNGEFRELLTLWNYHIKKDSFQILYLYDNWPGRVDYPLGFDSLTLTFNGYDTFIANGGIAAEEKVEWIISEDGKEIRSTEYNHLYTDPKDYWPKTFEFILRRIE